MGGAHGGALRTATARRARLRPRSRACAATGTRADLVYVSPKSGRAVSRAAGAPYADRLLRLPDFLRDEQAPAEARDLAGGFALTGYFLTRHVLEPRGLMLADERAHFIAALERALPSVA